MIRIHISCIHKYFCTEAHCILCIFPSAVYSPVAISVIVSPRCMQAFLCSERATSISSPVMHQTTDWRDACTTTPLSPAAARRFLSEQIIPSQAYSFHLNVSGKGVSAR